MRLAESKEQMFERHLQEVHDVMNPKPRHELIKIISGLLIENFAMKQALEVRQLTFAQKLLIRLKGLLNRA